MDPDETLRRIRILVRAALAGDDPDPADLALLAELVDNLDEWISKGGFLPHAWSWHNPSVR